MVVAILSLPLMNGIEFFAELPNVFILQNIPVIAISAGAMKCDCKDFIADAFDGSISKPIESVLVDKIIKIFLNYKTDLNQLYYM